MAGLGGLGFGGRAVVIQADHILGAIASVYRYPLLHADTMTPDIMPIPSQAMSNAQCNAPISIQVDIANVYAQHMPSQPSHPHLFILLTRNSISPFPIKTTTHTQTASKPPQKTPPTPSTPPPSSPPSATSAPSSPSAARACCRSCRSWCRLGRKSCGSRRRWRW